MVDDRRQIDSETVQKLVAHQFPQWADLPVRPVAHSGWDNSTFHLGNDMLVRLPSAERYVAQIEKERRWLPYLARHLSLTVPHPLAFGEPGEYYPFPWSVYRWIEGDSLAQVETVDNVQLARDLARFLRALRDVDATGGPAAGKHNFYRGCPPAVYDSQTREAIRRLEGRIDQRAATAIWEAGLDARFSGRPVWLHGDVAPGNLIVRDGRLAAVIDFGSLGVGDPACDLYIAWTSLEGEARTVFAQAVDLDDATWLRGRAWVLWKVLFILSGMGKTNANEADKFARVADRMLAEPTRII